MPAPVITPAGPLVLDGGAAQNATSNIAADWTHSGGVLSAVTPFSVTWTLPNQTGNWTLMAEDAGGNETDALIVGVRGIIPNAWTFENPINVSKEVQVFRPKRGPTQMRVLNGHDLVHDWELSNPNSDPDSFDLFEAFYAWHHGRATFDLLDPIALERRTYLFDSGLQKAYNKAGGVQWSVRIKEEWPYAVTPL